MKNSGILKEELLQGKYSQLLKEIYLDESMLEYQNKRYADAITEFEKLYGEKEVEVYSAPGVVKCAEITQTTSLEWCLLHQST